MRADIRNDKGAESKIAGLQARVITLAQSMSDMTASADTRKLDAQIAAETAKLRGLQQQMTRLQADADTTKAAARIADLQKQSFHLNESLSKLTARVDITAAETKIKAIDAELRVLGSNAKAVKLSADSTAILAQIEVIKSSISKLKAEAGGIRLGADIDPARLVAAEAALLGFEAAAEKLPKAAVAGDIALGALGKALTGTGRGWGFLTRGVTLFGGAFNRVLPVVLASVAVWHVLADVIIELAAVWIPASLAVGAFAVAASDAAREIVSRMQAVHTVMDATGQAVPPMTNAMEKLHAAVRPQVYQLFGDALTVVNSRTGVFAQVAKATGTVLDQLAARMVFAVTAGNKLGTSTTQLSGFWKTAITDVAKLGDSIGNLFGIFGNLFKALPGFAAGLLTIGDDFTKILEAASAAAVPVLKWVLLLHGYILYTGLAATATLAFIGGIANLAKQFVTFAAGSVLAGIGALKSFGSALASIGLALAAYVESIIVADGASATFAAALAPLAANPMFWVAAAAVALGALAITIGRSKDAAQQFNDTMQQTIANAQLGNVVTVIQNAQAATAAKLADSNVKLNQALAEQGNRTGQASRSWGDETAAVYNAAKAHQELVNGLGKLDSQQQLVSGRFADLTRKYGGSTAALGLLNAAGITGAQITDTQGHAWAQALIQISSTVQAYKAMGTQAGVLGNDLDVLGRTATDQYQAVQKLNQAWGAFITDVTGTQGSFDTVAQGFFTLNDHAGKLHFTLGKLKVAYADQKVAIDSLTPAGVALNQAFGEQVGNLDKLFASWRTAGLSGNLFSQGVAAAIAPLEKYARGSQEATAQLVALGQEAGYQGPISLSALNKYLGISNKALSDTAGSTRKLKDITDTATTQEALLTGAMQAQGNFIANQLIGDINNASLAYNGVEGAAKAYGTAIAKFGRGTRQANDAQNTLIDRLTRSGIAAGNSTGQISALAAKILGIPRSQALAEVNAEILRISHVSPGAAQEFGAFATAVGNGDIKSRAAKNSARALADQLLGLTGNSKTAHAEFITLAGKIGLTRDKAEALWKEISGSLSPTIAHQANVVLTNSRNRFEDWAKNSLGFSTDKADVLYKKLETQLGPGLDKLSNRNIINSKQKFDDWAKNGLGLSHDKAEALRLKLIGLQNQINGMHGKNVGVNFVGSGTGSIAFKESIPGVTLGPSSSGILGFHAAGGYISGGTPGKDSVLGMLMPGEVVVPTAMVRAGAVDHLRGKLPGFAAGGAIPGSTGSARFSGLEGPAGVLSSGQARAAQVEKKFGEAVEKHFFEQVIAKFKRDMNALSGGGPAIVRYARSFLGKIPYVFGGNSLSGGIDCSGFTQQVYSKFGIHAPRTSEAQYAWATKSGPVPGSLAFYVSPAGGPPPGHVAIVQDANSVISQGGGMGPKIESLRFMPLMGTGVPKGGFPQGAGGGGNGAIGGGGAVQAIAMALLRQYGWGNQWNSFNNLETREAGWCVTLNHMILTRRGWLKHDEVVPGDETIGYNQKTGKSEWTRVTAVHHYEDKPVVTYGNKYWQATFTPGHRWLTETAKYQSDHASLPVCPLCGFTGKTAKLGIRNHMIRSHGWEKPAGRPRIRTEWQEPELTPWNEFTGRERIILSRPADTGPGLPVTDREAALLGWIAGDGCVVENKTVCRKAPPAPPANWQERTEAAPFGLRRDGTPKKGAGGRPYKDLSRTHVPGGRGLSVSISQAKPEHFAAIEDALTGIPDVGRYMRDNRGRRSGDGIAKLINYTWRLPADYARDLLLRAGNPKKNAVEQVLHMSASQRQAWLQAMIAAEGTRGEMKTTVYQNEGTIADAIELAVYLEGYRPGRTSSRAGQVAINLTVPHIGGPQRNSFGEDAGTADVWCVTTELGSWTTRNDSGVFLTGNSMTARNPSSGAYGLAQFINGPSEYFQYGGNPNTALGQLTAMLNYINQRYGAVNGPNAAWAHEVSAGWYGKGGRVPGMAAGGLAGMAAGGDPMAATVKQIKAVAALRARINREESYEGRDYLGLRRAFLRGPARDRTKTVMSEIGTLFKLQGAEQIAYGRLAGTGLTAGNLAHFGTSARAVSRTAGDKALNARPGGHPGWAAGLRDHLANLDNLSRAKIPGGNVTLAGIPGLFQQFLKDRSGTFAISAGPGSEYLYKAGQSAGTLIPQSADRGTVLAPGMNLRWNGLGRPEPLVPPGSSAGCSGEVHVHLHVHGPVGSQPELEAWLLKSVRSLVRTRGGGNAQYALGRHEPKGW